MPSFNVFPGQSPSKYILTLVIAWTSLCSVGCIGTVIAVAASQSALEGAMDELYLDQTQALRLDEGLSLKEFDREMWDYVPSEYSRIQRSRISAYVMRHSPSRDERTRGRHVYNTKVNTTEGALKDYPELEVRYRDLDKKALLYRGKGSFWDMKSMMYRAFRLNEDATEEQIVSELRKSDLEFNRRYEMYQKREKADQ